jgi:SWI/SNF-related matrix-associated actin-dependent regulator of chromatin subfamily A member 5
MQVCNHPYQIANAEPEPYETGEHLIRASGKFIVLEKLVNELVLKQKKKILIFSGFTKMLDLVEEFLLLIGGDGESFRSIRLDGRTPRAR